MDLILYGSSNQMEGMSQAVWKILKAHPSPIWKYTNII